MKNLAILIMFGVSSVALSAEEYTIQTISAKKEVSITPAFEKKVQKSALPMRKKKEGECNIVTVGKYPTAKAASADLKKAREISKDAFVRTLERATPKVCEGKSDIHDAIEYYKHSPYHSFRPVALQYSKSDIHDAIECYKYSPYHSFRPVALQWGK